MTTSDSKNSWIYQSWIATSSLKLTLFSSAGKPRSSSSRANLFSMRRYSPRHSWNFRKRRANHQYYRKTKNGYWISYSKIINSVVSYQITKNSQTPSTITGRTEERSSNFHYLENYGIRLKMNTVICSPSKPDKKTREV